MSQTLFQQPLWLIQWVHPVNKSSDWFKTVTCAFTSFLNEKNILLLCQPSPCESDYSSWMQSVVASDMLYSLSCGSWCLHQSWCEQAFTCKHTAVAEPLGWSSLQTAWRPSFTVSAINPFLLQPSFSVSCARVSWLAGRAAGTQLTPTGHKERRSITQHTSSTQQKLNIMCVRVRGRERPTLNISRCLALAVTHTHTLKHQPGPKPKPTRCSREVGLKCTLNSGWLREVEEEERKEQMNHRLKHFSRRDADARSTSAVVAFSPYFSVTGRLIFLTCQEGLSALSVASALAEQLKLDETMNTYSCSHMMTFFFRITTVSQNCKFNMQLWVIQTRNSDDISVHFPSQNLTL